MSEKIIGVQQQVTAVRHVLEQNMQQAIVRGEHLVEIEQASVELQESAEKFRKGGEQVRRHFCRRHWRSSLVIAGILLLILGLVIVLCYPRSN